MLLKWRVEFWRTLGGFINNRLFLQNTMGRDATKNNVSWKVAGFIRVRMWGEEHSYRAGLSASPSFLLTVCDTIAYRYSGLRYQSHSKTTVFHQRYVSTPTVCR